MENLNTMRRLSTVALMLLLCVGVASAQQGRRSKAHPRKHSAVSNLIPEAADEDVKLDDQLRLKFVDGTDAIVDDAGETENGFWYTRSGVTYLLPRDRVKSINRPQTVRPVAATQTAKLAIVGAPQTNSLPRPVWIYLLGGARVEADSADESTAGVWYQRGSLNIFIEHSRIERIEREDLESAAESKSSTKERGWTTGSAKIDSLIKQNGAKHGVDPYLIFCVMEQESHFSTRAVSPKGARGLMQLMPGTGARFGVRNPFSPGENIAAGTRYLKQLLNQFNGRVDLVLASYNAGEGAVVKFGHKVPPYRETREYVRRISYRYHRAKAPVARGTGTAGVPAL